MPLEAPLELPVFRGPLDLLLTLVERRRLEITDVSLALVTDQYLQAVRSLGEPDPGLLAEFLVIAARLVLIKSRALLLTEAAADEEEPVDDLAARLELYRRFKEAALALGARVESGFQAFPRSPRAEEAPLLPDLAPIDAAVLKRLLLSIGKRAKPVPAEPPPPAPRASVAEQVDLLRSRLRVGPVAWDDLAPDDIDGQIALFLAILELVKCRELLARQPDPFGSIVLEARDLSDEALIITAEGDEEPEAVA